MDENPEEAARRIRRYEIFESLGLDVVKHDLLNGGHRHVGGPPEVREMAWEWVRMKELEQDKLSKKKDDLLILKPTLWGMGVNINEIGRRLFQLWKRRE